VEDHAGLLKVYLKELREILIREKIFVTQKRWMRIFRILKLIAFTRAAGEKKRICLSDCFLMPYFIAKAKQEFLLVEQLNLDLIENLARVYGSNRLYAVMEKHFWLLRAHKAQIKVDISNNFSYQKIYIYRKYVNVTTIYRAFSMDA
jgi:hypothetical protein